MRVGVLGAGDWADRVHLPSLLRYERCEVVGLADPDEQRLRACAARHRIERAFVDPADLIGCHRIDAVVIATPHHLHYALAKAALRAGLHVLVEKPMTLTAADAWDLVETARSSGLHLTVGYELQHTEHARWAHDFLAAGGIGDLLAMAALYSSAAGSLYAADTIYADRGSGGGQAHTQGTHVVGMMLHVSGARVREVAAFTTAHGLNVDLADAVSCRMQDGAVATVASTGSLARGQGAQQEVRYYGSDGFVLQDLRAGTLTVGRNDGGVEEVAPLPDSARRMPYAPARTLVDLAAGNHDNPAPAAAAARAVELIEAALRSDREGRIVTVDELSTTRRS